MTNLAAATKYVDRIIKKSDLETLRETFSSLGQKTTTLRDDYSIYLVLGEHDCFGLERNRQFLLGKKYLEFNMSEGLVNQP